MTRDAKKVVQENLIRSAEAKVRFKDSAEAVEMFVNAADAVVAAYKNGGRIYIAGNGGSAADAQHLAAEFVSKLARNRDPLPAEALTVDTSIITAIGNDYGYDEIFARQIAGKMTAKDIFLGITTSGNSRNIVRALELCKNLGIKSIVFSGHDGGKVRELADFCVIATGSETATIQEVHIVLAHSLCECVEEAVFN
jgi:D-sedoheptulose 7-phosphate isomerase